MLKETAILFAPGQFGGAEKLILDSFLDFPARLWLIREQRNSKPCDYFISRCREKNIEFKVFESTARFDFNLVNILKTKIELGGVKLVHSHGLKANFISSFLPVKRVATQHGRTSHSYKMKAMEFLEGLALLRAHALICVSSEMYQKENASSSYLVVNFVTAPNRPTTLKNKPNVISMAFFGRLSPEKNILALIEALKERNDFHLHIFGDGPLRQEVATESFKNKNVSYEGFISNPINEMQKYDCIVLPSLREGNPIVIIEAILSGLPVLAANVGGIPQMVTNNGVLFNPLDKADMIKAMETFKHNYKNIITAALSKRHEARERYSFDRWKRQTLNIYKQVLQNS